MKFGKIANGLKKTSKSVGKRVIKEVIDAGLRGLHGALQGASLNFNENSKVLGGIARRSNASHDEWRNRVRSIFFSKISPKKASPIASPSLTSLEDQIEEIIKTLKSLQKTQEKDLNNKVSQAIKESRLDRESQLEHTNDNEPHAIREEKDSYNLKPLEDSLDGFIAALDEAISKLSNLDIGQNSSGGMFDWFDRKKKRSKGKSASKLEKGIKKSDLLDKNGRELNGAARQSRIDKLIRERGIRSGKGFGAKLVGEASEKRIAKLARPLLMRAGLKTVVKSIPLVGTGAGLIFAVSRLAEGDVVGAGLEAVGGIGSMATAIPATIASVSRDIYFDTYGVQPEEDPEGPQRMAEVTNVVKNVFTEEFSEQKKESVTSKKPKKDVIPFKSMNDSALKNVSWPSQTIKPNTKPTGNIPSVSTGESLITPKQEQSPSASSSGGPGSELSSASATLVQKTSEINDGAQIQSASMNVKQAASQDQTPIVQTPNVFPNQSVAPPNEIVSSAAPVPDPNYYNNFDLMSQFYFTAAT